MQRAPPRRPRPPARTCPRRRWTKRDPPPGSRERRGCRLAAANTRASLLRDRQERRPRQRRERSSRWAARSSRACQASSRVAAGGRGRRGPPRATRPPRRDHRSTRGRRSARTEARRGVGSSPRHELDRAPQEVGRRTHVVTGERALSGVAQESRGLLRQRARPFVAGRERCQVAIAPAPRGSRRSRRARRSPTGCDRSQRREAFVEVRADRLGYPRVGNVADERMVEPERVRRRAVLANRS